MIFMNTHEHYLNEAFKEAFRGIRNNLGGPFGAVVVMNGSVIGKGCNSVVAENDPTAHAEIVAIRQACRNINNFDLSGATLYSTCEPCPISLSSIYWANIKNVYYCFSRYEAEEIGIKDNHIYNELNLKEEKRTLSLHSLSLPLAQELFSE
jgi:tRNA(Arg) A34 adenosine deaminase TadA